MFILRDFFKYDFRVVRKSQVFPFDDSLDYYDEDKDVVIWTKQKKSLLFGFVTLYKKHELPDECAYATKDGSILYSYELQRRPYSSEKQWKSIGRLKIPMS